MRNFLRRAPAPVVRDANGVTVTPPKLGVKVKAAFTRDRVTTVLDVFALAGIAAGTALIFLPAGIIVLGVGVGFLSYMAAK